MGPLFEAVLEHYGKDKASVVFKHFPLGFHKNAQPAAEASMAAHEQGKFWEFHDQMFANAKALERADLEKYAQEVGLDLAKFKEALDTGKFTQRVKDDFDLGQKAGVGGTPTIFVNGRKYQGPRDPKGMIAVIDEQILGKKEQPAPAVDAPAPKPGPGTDTPPPAGPEDKPAPAPAERDKPAEKPAPAPEG